MTTPVPPHEVSRSPSLACTVEAGIKIAVVATMIAAIFLTKAVYGNDHIECRYLGDVSAKATAAA